MWKCKPKVNIKCNQCKKVFTVLFARRSRKFCSYQCSALYSKGKKHWWTPKTVFKVGHEYLEKEGTREKKILARLGTKMSVETRIKLGYPIKPVIYKRHHHQCWTNSYKDWRKSVFTRDNWTCKVCKKVGGTLQAHHILLWSEFPTERYKVSNGVTLCKGCHKFIHSKQYKGRKWLKRKKN